MIYYNSDQDHATTMARISGITLQSSKYWAATHRTTFNSMQRQFEGYLHRAMGYKASTQQDY